MLITKQASPYETHISINNNILIQVCLEHVHICTCCDEYPSKVNVTEVRDTQKSILCPSAENKHGDDRTFSRIILSQRRNNNKLSGLRYGLWPTADQENTASETGG